jgi:hypothetical protein
MLLVLACGKPITEKQEANDVSESPKFIYLRAVRSFSSNYYENAEVPIEEHNSGFYSVPVMVDLTSYNGRLGDTWLHIEHNGFKHCYLGNSKYYYDHSRVSGSNCSSNTAWFYTSRFKATIGFPIYMRIEESECSKCGHIFAEVNLTRI